MLHSILLLAALVSVGSAQSTVALLLPGFDAQALLASVVGSDAAATTYVVTCAPSIDSSECGVPGKFVITEGPGTVHFTLSVKDLFEDVDCSLGGTTTADCTVTAVSGTDTTTSHTNIGGPELATLYLPATLTDNLGASTGAMPTISGPAETTTSAAGTAAATSSSNTGGAVESGNSKTTSASSLGASPTASNTSSAASAKSSTAGMPQITGNSGWAAGGMAVALAVAGL